MLSVNKFLVILLLVLSSQAQAKEFFEPYQSVRQLGMGGVFVFDESDSSSFYQNPAYSCFTEGFNWDVFNLLVGFGDINNYETFTASGGTSIDGFSSLNRYYGKRVRADVTALSSLSLPCFGSVGYYTGVVSFKMHDPAYPTMSTFYRTEYAFSVGGGFKIGPNVSFGLDVKRVDRKGGPHDFGPASLADIASSTDMATMIDEIETEGVGYGLDIGATTRLSQMPFNPTLSIAWRDVGSTAFTVTKGDTSPERQKDNLVLGATIDGGVPGLGMAAGLEYRHITDNDEQIGKKIHLGAEVSLAFLDMRAGFYQGYTTYGVGIDLWLFNLDAALYSVETGVYPGQSPEKRGMINLSLDLSFDPDFHLTESSGRRRKLKQRR